LSVFGTSASPGHKFLLVRSMDEKAVLTRFDIQDDKNLYYYNPFSSSVSNPRSLSELNDEQREIYEREKRNFQFAKQYRKFTGRDWIANYPANGRPIHHMWSADYFGQEHWALSRETKYFEIPPVAEMREARVAGYSRAFAENEVGSDGASIGAYLQKCLSFDWNRRLNRFSHVCLQPRVLEKYREKEFNMNMTLSVLSCAPRVFEIKNFLSHAECDHMLWITSKLNMSNSQTASDTSSTTRSSENTWVPRDSTPVVDSIYRRAADLLKIDESLLRERSHNEGPEELGKYPIAESLQMVHYSVGDNYKPHFDFGLPSLHEKGTVRFATLLLYLNEGMEGGSTSFPKWVNAETQKALKVAPEKGKVSRQSQFVTFLCVRVIFF
jgi:prolyl 4-hydroxylase